MHNWLGKLLWYGRYEKACPNLGRMAKKKDKDVLLETMEANQNKA
jgi:hypothetical protein